jgi:hypothetical protein
MHGLFDLAESGAQSCEAPQEQSASAPPFITSLISSYIQIAASLTGSSARNQKTAPARAARRDPGPERRPLSEMPESHLPKG